MSELLELAERIVGQASAGEQVEVFLGRSHQTSVKVFDGAVESLSSADTSGVGVRVIVDGRQGFAYAASLEDSIVAETLAEDFDIGGQLIYVVGLLGGRDPGQVLEALGVRQANLLIAVGRDPNVALIGDDTQCAGAVRKDLIEVEELGAKRHAMRFGA